MANSNIKYYILPLFQGLQIYQKEPNKRLALVVGMLPWKDVVADWVLEDKHVQIQRHFNKKYFYTLLLPFIKYTNPVIYIWGYKAPDFFINYVRKHNLDIFFLEDGFIRSAPVADSNTPPLSIVMDSQAPYFDTTRPNDLTDLIANFDFEQTGYDEDLAQEMLDYYLSHRVSKYNHQPYVDVKPIYGKKTGKRILILGQVPNDDAIKYGGGENITLLDVTKQAIKDNPNAQIIVKPHPMTLEDTNLLDTLQSLNCLILAQPIHLVDALETIDHVYTITSLGGFEALLRGKKVTTLGRPFYLYNNNQYIHKLFCIIFLNYIYTTGLY
ncbi:capsular polysaccharide biosynthesis protein [Psychrobacter sp. I-STPA6b]|uniref:capsular polysaccharide export protein, LipB/KpsS family n=1 Tax=Psychrobacter sp. I-STPA6b TaxID=2585718 RepID=UPI001D0BF7CC|nr:capsular polysaccharide biosynthesis protein [Psychrobacter sp. I-STPA6b]